MSRRPRGKYDPNFSKERHAELAIHASRLKRLLPAFARRHKHKLEDLIHIATLAQFLCPICVGPIKTPQLYLVDEKPRAILCACCMNAI